MLKTILYYIAFTLFLGIFLISLLITSDNLLLVILSKLTALIMGYMIYKLPYKEVLDEMIKDLD